MESETATHRGKGGRRGAGRERSTHTQTLTTDGFPLGRGGAVFVSVGRETNPTIIAHFLLSRDFLICQLRSAHGPLHASSLAPPSDLATHSDVRGEKLYIQDELAAKKRGPHALLNRQGAVAKNKKEQAVQVSGRRTLHVMMMKEYPKMSQTQSTYNRTRERRCRPLSGEGKAQQAECWLYGDKGL